MLRIENTLNKMTNLMFALRYCDFSGSLEEFRAIWARRVGGGGGGGAAGTSL